MSKTKHPASMVLLTESEQFVHISALLTLKILWRSGVQSQKCPQAEI